jgi:hypothetical protein
MARATHKEASKMAKIRCELNEGGGTFHETFDRVDGWQDEVRGWVSHLQNRFGVKAGSKLSMWHAANGVTFSFVKQIAI